MYNVYCGQPIYEGYSLLNKLLFKMLKIRTTKCNFLALCAKCKERKRMLCHNHHLHDRPTKIIQSLEYYSKNVPSYLIRNMTNIVSGNVERSMRD